MDGLNAGGGDAAHTTLAPRGEEAMPSGRYAWLSRAAPYKREAGADAPNEDAWLALPLDARTTVLAVADGVGGHARGDAASRLAIDCLREALGAATLDPGHLREPILDAIERCNAELLADGRGSATTVAVVEIRDATMRPYHVGDSSILVVGQRGRLKFRSIAHSPIGYGIEAGLLDEDAALGHEDSHWLSNLVGSSEMRIEVGAPLALARFDTVLLCSDGLTDNLALEAIGARARSGPLGRAVDALGADCDAAMAGEDGHPDDLTVLLYRAAAAAARARSS